MKRNLQKVRDVFNMINHFGIENISRYYNLSINEVYTIVKPACIEYDKGTLKLPLLAKSICQMLFLISRKWFSYSFL